MDPEAFKTLETRVGRLLTAVRRLRDEKAHIEARLSQREQASKQLAKERAWVRRRLGRLMDDLERLGTGRASRAPRPAP